MKTKITKLILRKNSTVQRPVFLPEARSFITVQPSAPPSRSQIAKRRFATVLARRKVLLQKPAHTAGLAVVLMLFSYGAVQLLSNKDFYAMSQESQTVVGPINQELSKKLSYDAKDNVFKYNQDAAAGSEKPDSPQAALAAAQKAEKGQKHGGGANNYAVSLSAESAKGVDVQDTTDTTGQMAVSLVPQFKTRAGKMVDGRVVYPLKGRDAQLVYTIKANGLKEDIVLPQEQGDNIDFSYKLKMPETLEAKLMPNGSIGIYSADATLFGNISFGSEEDRAKVENARKQGEKTHLAFIIPAPVINQTGKGSDQVKTNFTLEGDIVTVKSSGLSKASYPLSIDPSIVVTSASDFAKGNFEGGIEFDATNNQVKRGALTGATIPSWTTGANLPVGSSSPTTVVNNGYIYLLTSSQAGVVYYASINSNGSLGTWTTTTSFPDRVGYAAVAYNNFIYVIGGGSEDDTLYSGADYAPINANGTIGTWASTNDPGITSKYLSSVVYNGYVYTMGGNYYNDLFSEFEYNSVVNYAPINANGTIGTWASTSSFTTGRSDHTTVVYNGYMYVMGGYDGSVELSDVQYAPINANGTIGTWATTTNISSGRVGHTTVVNSGYIYMMGGYTGGNFNDVQYAQINSNGTIGTWSTTTAFTTARRDHASVVYNGYLYVIGGSGAATSVQYGKVDPAGVTGSYTATSSFTTARYDHSTVAYNGYLYVIGGFDNNNYADVQYAQINTNGTIGTWAATTSFPTARYGHTSVAYNSYLYVIGGAYYDGDAAVFLGDIQYAPINANGTIGTWAATTGFASDARSGHTSVAYNGFLYVVGGSYFDGGSNVYFNDVQYATINANGTIGTWASTAPFSSARSGHTTVVANGYLYVIGGSNNFLLNDVQYAQINANGTVNAWAATTSFSGARTGHASVVANGYLYVIGGESGGTSNTVQYAPVNANGTIGTWATTVNFTTARYSHTSVVYNGFVYVIGGYTTGETNGVQYARINNGGSGKSGTWALDDATSFATPRDGHSSVVHNGYLYVIGGSNGGPLNDIQYAPINANGTIGTWTTAANTFTTSRSGHTSVVHNGYLYVIGGFNGTGRNDIQYAPINANGSLGTWTTAANTFTTGRNKHTSVVHNGYLYVIGGFNGTGRNDIQYAPINANGSLGTWTTAANTFTTGRHSHTSVIYNGYLYVIGGTTGGSFLNDVQYAPINANGSLGTWAYTSALLSKRFAHSTIAQNGYIYVIGGSTGIEELNNVHFAPISAGGNIGAWSSVVSNLLSSRQGHTSVVSNGNLYAIGGSSFGGRVNTVEFAAQQAIPRKGSYSILTDQGGDAVATKLLYRGAGPGVTLSYKSALSSTGSFGATNSILPLSSNVLSSFNNTEGRYRQLNFTLDDSQSAVFPDSLSAPSTITDFELYFHPGTKQRLRGGKTFSNEQVRALDATPQ